MTGTNITNTGLGRFVLGLYDQPVTFNVAIDGDAIVVHCPEIDLHLWAPVDIEAAVANVETWRGTFRGVLDDTFEDNVDKLIEAIRQVRLQ